MRSEETLAWRPDWLLCAHGRCRLSSRLAHDLFSYRLFHVCVCVRLGILRCLFLSFVFHRFNYSLLFIRSSFLWYLIFDSECVSARVDFSMFRYSTYYEMNVKNNTIY